MTLTPNQRVFASALANYTGLNPNAVGAWELGEQSGSAAQARQAAGNNNWLDIGYFDSGPGQIAYNQAFKNPQTAAQQTAKFLQGKWGGAAEGIQDILDTRGQGPKAQLAAVAASPWASSHYGGAGNLQSLLSQVNLPAASGAPSPLPGGTTPTPGAVGRTNMMAPMLSTALPVIKTPSQQSEDKSLFGTLASLASTKILDASGNPLQMPDSATTWKLLAGLTDTSARIAAMAPSHTQGITDPGQPGSNRGVKAAIAAANTIGSNNYNYEWGGGHNPAFGPTHGVGHGSGPGTGYDCSGAVSAILHSVGKLNSPLVSGDFMTYGEAGPGQSPNDITIYANPEHVFMKIGGKYFGTSAQNPGGGAGWFKTAYTQGFTERHVSL